MTFSLYDATVPVFLQSLHATHGWLAKVADVVASDENLSEAELIEAKLSADMFPLNRQLRACAMHSQGALEGCFKGVFSPDLSPHPETFVGLRERIAEAIGYLEALDRNAVEGLLDKPMRFEFRDTRWPFLAQDFLTGFSLPNFFFHTTTGYAILRHHGLPLGKRDYLGALPMQPEA